MAVAAFSTRDVISALRAGDGNPPTLALIGLIGAGAGMFALRSVEGAVAERTGQSFAAAVRRTLFLHMSRVPVSITTERRAGSMALRYVGDLSALKGWVSKGLARLISAAVTIPAAFLILYLIHPALAIGAALPIGAALVVIIWLGIPLWTAHAELRSHRARLAASMAERIPQALALRRSGRLKTELRVLQGQSDAIALAATYRAWLAETMRALPDIASGLAGALCLWICFSQRLPVEDAVAALTALALVIWPLRRLADVRNRQQAFEVAASKLERTLSDKTLKSSRRRPPRCDAPVLEAVDLRLAKEDEPISLRIGRGQSIHLAGGSRLLTTAAGLDRAHSGKINVLGLPPTATPIGSVLYLGRFSPQLKGSLRRECTIGLNTIPDDQEILAALERAGMLDLHDRLGGLSGHVSEGRRNLSARERSGMHLVRGLLAKPDLALVDADEIGLTSDQLKSLLDHFASHGCATVVGAYKYAQASSRVVCSGCHFRSKD